LAPVHRHQFKPSQQQQQTMSIPYTPPTHRPHDTGGFFRHHGLWAMGIRLFRRLRFGAKAAIVSGLFLVPALIGFSLYLGQVQRDIEQSRGELAGVQLIEKLAPVLHALTDLRNASRANGADFAPAASLLQQGHAALQRAEAELQRVDQQFVSHLQLGDEAAALHRTLSGLPLGASAQTVEDVLEQTVNFYNLLSARSGVIMDQDSADLQLLLAYTREIPFLAEAVGQMRSWGTVALIKQRQDATSMQRVYGWTARAQKHVAESGAWVQGARNADPALGQLLDLTVLEQARAYLKRANATFVKGDEALVADVDGWWQAGSQLVNQLYADQGSTMQLVHRRIEARLQHAQLVRNVSLAVGALALTLALYFFYCFYRVMNGGLQETRRHLTAMTSGDLTTQPKPWGADDIAVLMSSLREMQDALRAIVSDVRQASDHIVDSSNQIADGSSDLSARTEDAALSLDKTAASMDSISQIIQHSAEAAAEAASIAAGNVQAAHNAQAIMQRVVTTMDGIGSASSKIGDIIGTIDGIAFQTNILALNAAVEAARAGESGRGFAVVASEVRSLAQRSATAAREIKALIGASVEQTQTGAQVVNEARDAITTLLASADSIGRLIERIASDARNGATGIRDIEQATRGLDQSTQQNAALVDKTAAAASTLRQHAQALAQRVSQFKLH
jgi:methyl-accepting chemotaxis protein